MEDWLPEAYLRFSDERTRPARDLLARVPLNAPELVYDLGCGPGNSTALLRERYPQAKVIGLDTSQTMLAKARNDLPEVQFIEADLAVWEGDRNADLLFANAAFQWVPDHAAVLLRLLKGLKAGSVLALQMPDNLDEPSHRLMRETAQAGPWASALKDAAGFREVIRTPHDYYNLLKPYCRSLEIWNAAYYHALQGAQGIVDFVSTTGLRPFLDPLDESTRDEFITAYRAGLAMAYPEMGDGKVLMRFPRLFIAAQA
ncbi:MAG: trans-aconitate 2-methyltransferase [Aestuariivirga sp.]